MEPYTYAMLDEMGFFFCPLCKNDFEDFNIKDEKIIDISNCDIVLVKYTDPRAIGAVVKWASTLKTRFIMDHDPAVPGQLIIRLIYRDSDKKE